MAVHNRSLSGIDGSQALRVRKKRFAQAVSIAEDVAGRQVAQPALRLVVTGDFNAFEFTDGFVDAVGVITGEFLGVMRDWTGFVKTGVFPDDDDDSDSESDSDSDSD